MKAESNRKKGRGGARKGAGRKPNKNAGERFTIYLPTEYAVFARASEGVSELCQRLIGEEIARSRSRWKGLLAQRFDEIAAEKTKEAQEAWQQAISECNLTLVEKSSRFSIYQTPDGVFIELSDHPLVEPLRIEPWVVSMKSTASKETKK